MKAKHSILISNGPISKLKGFYHFLNRHPEVIEDQEAAKITELEDVKSAKNTINNTIRIFILFLILLLIFFLSIGFIIITDKPHLFILTNGEISYLKTGLAGTFVVLVVSILIGCAIFTFVCVFILLVWVLELIGGLTILLLKKCFNVKESSYDHDRHNSFQIKEVIIGLVSSCLFVLICLLVHNVINLIISQFNVKSMGDFFMIISLIVVSIVMVFIVGTAYDDFYKIKYDNHDLKYMIITFIKGFIMLLLLITVMILIWSILYFIGRPFTNGNSKIGDTTGLGFAIFILFCMAASVLYISVEMIGSICTKIFRAVRSLWISWQYFNVTKERFHDEAIV